ncbi:MAG TPA: M13 family metallopeptidase [Thermoanaerobaculia bacterium]|nr:M13 family metallopeptidase [Thermoanaerobaculia bacterium]
MKTIRRVSLLSLGLGLLLCAGVIAAAPAGPAPTVPATASTATSAGTPAGPLYDPANLDPSVSPCVDFFRYADGGWATRHPRPADHASWGRLEELSERNRAALRAILEAAAAPANPPAAPDNTERKIGDFYASCMDEAAIERQGLTPLQPELARIDAVADVPALVDELAHLQSEGIRVPFGSAAIPSFRNSAEVVLDVREGELGLPDRDYYLKDDPASKKIRDEYGKHVARLLELSGLPAEQAALAVPKIFALETRLAQAMKTRAERRDAHGNDHWTTLPEMAALTPHLPWERYVKDLGVSGVSGANLRSPAYLKALDAELAGQPIADWRLYLRWRLIEGMAPNLGAAFVAESFHFDGTVLRGTAENLPRWGRCVRSVDGHMGEALGRIYVDKYFPPAAKRRALEMVDNLTAALKDDLVTLPWMGEATRAAAQKKLAAIGRKIGYPDQWIDYSPLQIARGSYAENVLAAQRFAFRRQIDQLGKPVDRARWNMTPPTVNASYTPPLNEISFPAGILQPPFFDPAADDAWNYGAIGAVIGHEMTHGFDDQGSQFDDQGNLRNWWAPADLTNFKGRAECVNRHYSSFSVDGVAVNGKLVLGESIADLGGLKIAYAAYQRSLAGKEHRVDQGLSPDQRFFLAFAGIWAASASPEAERLQLATNPHPLPRFRVDGVVSDMPEFARAFSCKTGDPMVRPDSERCQVW